jgi:hypothetical protein
VNIISEEKTTILIDGFYDGKSNRELAKAADVALRTVISARKWQRQFWLENPEYAALATLVCGCGRPINHPGRCNFIRTTRAANPVAALGVRELKV